MADRIIVVGSLNPEKEVQDRVRVLSGGGTVPCIITETEAETWLKESLLQAEGETQAIHQTEP